MCVCVFFYRIVNPYFMLFCILCGVYCVECDAYQIFEVWFNVNVCGCVCLFGLQIANQSFLANSGCVACINKKKSNLQEGVLEYSFSV